MRKGQAEFIVIIGIAVLAAVAILFSLQGSDLVPTPLPPGIALIQKDVKGSFLTLAKSGTDEMLEVMETHGGYLSLAVVENNTPYTVPPYETFGRQGVPYWQQCDADLSPAIQDITARLEKGMKIYILNNLNSLEQSFQKSVAFDTANLQVSANILDHKIDYSVSLPMTIQGYPTKGLYTFSQPTNFGRIIGFAQDMSSELRQKRHLEYFTIASLHLSRTNRRDGHSILPTTGVLSRCGETVFRSPQEVSREMKRLISYAMATVQSTWWSRVPLDPAYPRGYAIESVNGNTYPDLEVRMLFPDDFEISADAVFLTNTKLNVESPITAFNVRQCVTFYNQRYNVDFPLIFRVKDDVTGNYFHFATRSAIEAPAGSEKMTPSSTCKVPASPAQCLGLSCSGKVTVLDSSSSAIEGATAAFQGCYLGTSDSQGEIEGPVRCGTGELNVFYDASHDAFFEELSSTQLNPPGKSVTLHSIPNLTIRYFELKSNCSTQPLDKELVSSMATMAASGSTIPFSNLDESANPPDNCGNNSGACIGGLKDHVINEIVADYLPGGQAKIETWITHPEIVGANPEKPIPAIELADVTLTIPEENATLNYYIPTAESYFQTAVSCIDGPGNASAVACPYIATPSPVPRETRAKDIYNYFATMIAPNFSPPRIASVPYEFNTRLTSCGKKMIEVAT